MTDILSRLAALSFEHSSIPEAKEYIRRGFGFTASAGNRRWHLSDEEMNALTTAFRLRDDACRSLIALVKEAAGKIERLSKSMPHHHWQPIETAPRDGTPVMVWLEDEGFSVKALWKQVPADLKDDDDALDLKMWWLPEMDVYTEDDGMHRITHWQPRLEGPAAPEPTS